MHVATRKIKQFNPTGKLPALEHNGRFVNDSTDIAYYLESGFTPDYDSVGSSMADVVKNTSALSKSDRDAMADYLKSLPPRDGPVRPTKK